MASRQPKRYRKEQEGGSCRDFIPLAKDDYLDVHAHEGRLLTFGSKIGVAPVERETQKSDINWKAASSWTPLDDVELALDPDGARYNAAVEAHVMDETQSTVKGSKKSKRKKEQKPKGLRSRVSVSTDNLSVSFSMLIGINFRNGPTLSGRNVITTGTFKNSVGFLVEGIFALRHVLTAHRGSRLSSALLNIAAMNVTHQISLAQRVVFGATEPIRFIASRNGTDSILSSLLCTNPIPCHASMHVLHTNGIHEVSIDYCGCDRALPQHIQLLRRRLYPASQLITKNCATFDLLNLLEKLSLTTKASMYDFYRGLEKLTDNTGVHKPKSRYRVLHRMVLQWRHLKLLKWAGRAYDPAGVCATTPGELALRCPSCPHPGINLPDDWETAPAGMRFLYMMFICMDANFRLKNQLVSNYSQDPGLGIGWAYMVLRAPYESYVLSRCNDEDISTCVGLQALAQANTRFLRGLRYTGVGGAFCGRSEMVLPLAIGNLQKGERYANMDYVFGSAVQGTGLLLVLVSYDIACQWFINLFKRMFDHWPEDLRVPEKTKLMPAIPKLHEPMHGAANHQMYSLNYLPGVGASDLEYTSLGKTLGRKYRAATAERNIQVEGHRGLTEGLTEGVAEVWEALCVAWEQDAFPKHKANPYETEGVALSEAKAKKELAEEEKQRLAAGGVSLHATSAAEFIAMGLDIEETQRRLQRLAKRTTDKATARQAGGLTEQRNQLTARIRAWEVLLPVYLPGVLQHQANLRAANPSLQEAEHPEDQELWLPSRLPVDVRQRICVEGLPRIEEKLRTAQCYSALNAIRHVLKIKSRLVKFKNKNVRGQREGTRSRAIIDRVHERARAIAAKYRAGRAAKLQLSGPGDWETELQVLQDGDIRGYQDPNRLRQRAGRRGTLEDGQIDTSTPAEMETEEFSLLPEERSRRDGTGESRRTLSWIWLMKATSASVDDNGGTSTGTGKGKDKRARVADSPSDNEHNDADESDDILRSEWAKSRARAARAKEEVLLLREEMRRVLQFLEWKAKWWLGRAEFRSDDKARMEALQGYALAQAALHRSLAVNFRAAWEKPLGDEDPHTDPSTAHDIPLASRSMQDRDDEEDSEDDEDDSDEEDEEAQELEELERCAESDVDGMEEGDDEDGEDEEDDDKSLAS
ncbi:hypothetical protein NLJ89_g9630 [Agrocybe chaxingu]|uniref:CxC2-like cysteine cluster KDZ transposase-associated domain-containing protein n=1 Tax=Agrocybe chaxingu TaxID=84603 RepID=A0A9W8JSN7_9AGAR|nr:hypothetical protein NLJ89_g9630 [Agrocybe chaxingu]